MHKSKSNGLLRDLGRLVLFTVSIAFALGWLIAPDLVAKERSRVAAIFHLQSGPQRDAFAVVAFPEDAAKTSPLRPIAARAANESMN